MKKKTAIRKKAVKTKVVYIYRDFDWRHQAFRKAATGICIDAIKLASAEWRDVMSSMMRDQIDQISSKTLRRFDALITAIAPALNEKIKES